MFSTCLYVADVAILPHQLQLGNSQRAPRERGRDIWGCWKWLGSTLLLLLPLLPLLLRFVHTYFHSSAAPTFTYLIFGVSRSVRKSTTNCVYPTEWKLPSSGRDTVQYHIMEVMFIFFSFFLIFLSCIKWCLYIISFFILSSILKKCFFLYVFMFHREFKLLIYPTILLYYVKRAFWVCSLSSWHR